MCNEAARRIALGQVREDFAQLRIPLRFPEGAPNMAPLEGFRITDTTVIVRGVAETASEAELVSRRWSWPGPGGKPVYNYRSDDRDIRRGRCLIPVDSFFEFTAPVDPKRKRKDKWRFAVTGQEWFCIAGVWRQEAKVGEAFAMLTCPPGPDIALYHSRQVVVIARQHWGAWLDGSAPSGDLCVPAPAGTFAVEAVAND